MREEEERILCAAIYVDTGKPSRNKPSYSYPSTGLVFAGWRHGECFTLLYAWKDRLWFWERWAIERIQPHQLRGRNQGFVTSKGRFVDREEAGKIAYAVGQVGRVKRSLTSEDLY